MIMSDLKGEALDSLEGKWGLAGRGNITDFDSSYDLLVLVLSGYFLQF